MITVINALRALLLAFAIAAAVLLVEHQPGALLLVAVLATLGGASVATKAGSRYLVRPPQTAPGSPVRQAGRQALRDSRAGRLLGWVGDWFGYGRRVAAAAAGGTVRATCDVLRPPAARQPHPVRARLAQVRRHREIGRGQDRDAAPAASGTSPEPGTEPDSGTGADNGPAGPPASRRWDGAPETEAETRFFDAREAGYRGWIDQDGHRLSDEQAQQLWTRWVSPADSLQSTVDGPAAVQATTATTTAVLAEPEGSEMAETLSTTAGGRGQVELGHRGHAAIAALIREWETSQEARRYPETFIAWLHTQFAAAQQRPGVTWECMQAYHGRGPAGHMGVPEGMLQRFYAAYQESAELEAAAFRQLAQEYAAYVDQAEAELPRQFGREVIESVARAHRG